MVVYYCEIYGSNALRAFASSSKAIHDRRLDTDVRIACSRMSSLSRRNAFSDTHMRRTESSYSCQSSRLSTNRSDTRRLRDAVKREKMVADCCLGPPRSMRVAGITKPSRPFRAFSQSSGVSASRRFGSDVRVNDRLSVQRGPGGCHEVPSVTRRDPVAGNAIYVLFQGPQHRRATLLPSELHNRSLLVVTSRHRDSTVRSLSSLTLRNDVAKHTHRDQFLISKGLSSHFAPPSPPVRR